STIGSVGGNVTLTAGRNYTQTGGSVQTPAGDISIQGQNVLIEAANKTSEGGSEQHFKQSGVTVSVSSPLLSALQTADQMGSAASKTKDSRMQALAAANAALALKDAAGGLQALAQNPAQAAGVGINITLGSSRNDSATHETSSTAQASQVTAGGNVSIQATGAGADSKLTVKGSDITAGGQASLKADGAVSLEAARNTSEQHSTNNGSSGSIGIGINFGGSQNGVSINASASKSRGNADGSDVNWTNTHVNGSRVSIESGGDTTLKGAVVAGKQVTAKVGGNLKVESLQDTSTYDAKQQSAGVGVSLCIPPLCYGASSASASVSKSKVNGDYASVGEQSGIKAGDGGFQLEVKG
ncbi:MAG: hemagglutinin repeat-containing protein, partial [Burkholderiales bacterium]|nr:hemagglutinin repeat-containing protein [Burkholderiales bacterium]